MMNGGALEGFTCIVWPSPRVVGIFVEVCGASLPTRLAWECRYLL